MLFRILFYAGSFFNNYAFDVSYQIKDHKFHVFQKKCIEKCIKCDRYAILLQNK